MLGLFRQNTVNDLKRGWGVILNIVRAKCLVHLDRIHDRAKCLAYLDRINDRAKCLAYLDRINDLKRSCRGMVYEIT